MLSQRQLDEYRRMTPGQRLTMTLRAIDEHTPALSAGPPEIAKRRFLAIRKENDARNRAILEKLAEADDEGDASGSSD
jgi:hypothetical protein